jgi:hypothetical protein
MNADGFSINLDSETNFPGNRILVCKKNIEENGSTVVHAFTDRLKDFYIESRCASIVSIVLDVIFPDNDAWDNRTGIKGQNGRVYVDFVWV